MIVEEKYLSLNVLLTEQIPLPGSGCFYFEVICFRNYLLSRYWHHKIWDNLSIQVYMTKKLRQKFWYLDKKRAQQFWCYCTFVPPPAPLGLGLRLRLKLSAAFFHESSIAIIGINLVDVLLNWLNWFHFLFLEGGLLVMIDSLIFLSPFSLMFSRLTQLNSLPVQCFPLIYNLKWL